MKGMKAAVLFLGLGLWPYLIAQEAVDERKRSLSAFPILMYDMDIGLGFGGKAILKNALKMNESFDMMLFGSTRGEQRYTFIFSMPDFEIRQGTAYALAFDVKLDWNKLLNSNYFGTGNHSDNNEDQFPREMTKVKLTLGHAFTTRLIGELWARYAHYSVYGFKPGWIIDDDTPGAGQSGVSALSLRFRFDSRDSSFNPKKGIRAELQAEKALKMLGTDYDFWKTRLEFSVYHRSFFRSHIFAYRLWTQHLDGNAPYWELSMVGDGRTARGFKSERFIDNAMMLASIEYRFPIFWHFGGVLFTDAGRVWSSLSKFSFNDWHANWGWGLRYHLKNFVVRFDMGMSVEGMRIFFNFGHVF